MTRKTVINATIVLAIVLLGGIGYKISPLFLPQADLTLPVSTCNPGFQVCTEILPNGGKLEFVIEPRPIRALAQLKLLATIKGIDARKVEVDFDGTQMSMGYNHTTLSGSNGHFSGPAILSVCVTGTMEWEATVLIQSGNKRIAVPFRFEVAGR